MWTDYFDNTYLINLESRPERLTTARQQLKQFGIDHQILYGFEDLNGEYGIYRSLRALFDGCLGQNMKNVLVFEDDVLLVIDPAPTMEKALQQLPQDYDLLFLGPNTHRPFDRFYSPNLLPLTVGYGLHGVAYSRAGMQKVLDIPWTGIPIDKAIDMEIQSQGKCYATYPLIATQHNGYSDIQKKYMDQGYIIERFNNNVKHLL